MHFHLYTLNATHWAISRKHMVSGRHFCCHMRTSTGTAIANFITHTHTTLHCEFSLNNSLSHTLSLTLFFTYVCPARMYIFFTCVKRADWDEPFYDKNYVSLIERESNQLFANRISCFSLCLMSDGHGGQLKFEWDERITKEHRAKDIIHTHTHMKTEQRRTAQRENTWRKKTYSFYTRLCLTSHRVFSFLFDLFCTFCRAEKMQ